MEEIRWWTRLLLISGVISVVLLISAPLGYRFGVTGLGPAFGSLALAVLGAAIIAANPKQAEQYRAGKTKLLGFFVGQVMKETGGKANPKQVNDLVKSELDATG